MGLTKLIGPPDATMTPAEQSGATLTVPVPGTGDDPSRLPVSSTEADSAATGPKSTPLGTLIDPEYHAVDANSDMVMMTVDHYTQMRGIEDRLTKNQVNTTAAPLVPGFKLLHRIGKGAYGTVWEAHAIDCDEEHVAIKFFTCRQWEAMHREVSRIARLEGCSGVVSFKQYAERKADPPYYVMLYARNGSMADLLTKRGPLPVEEALELFSRIVETMAFVHAKGVIHCDLKPANILMNESGEPLVADFGQAQLGSQEAGSFGTLFYMPPEQADTTKTLPDANWDVYALGAMLFEMLTGQRPRADESTSKKLALTKDVRSRLTIYRKELEAVPVVDIRRVAQKPGQINRGKIDARLASIIESCLSIDPRHRPRSAGNLRERLRERLRWKRQRSVLAAGATVCGLMLGLLAMFGIYSASKIFEKSREARVDVLDHGLSRHARIAGRLVEEMLQDRVECSMKIAGEVAGSPIMTDLDRMVEQYRNDPEHADLAIPPDERRKYGHWLAGEAKEQLSWYQSCPASRSVGLLVVVDNRCFLLCQLKADGTPDAPADQSDWHTRFRMNWAWRDYYSGTGNHFDERGTDVRREPISEPHISHVYRSMAEGNPLRIDVAAPVKNAAGKTIALVICAIDLEGDLLEWIGDPDSAADPEQILVINDRRCWTSHPKAILDKLKTEDPPPIYEALDWVNSPVPGMAVYRDPIAGNVEYRAAHVPIRPYDTALNKDNPALRDTIWTVVVQISDEQIDAPLVSIRDSMYRLGWSALALVGALLAVLWVWWIRTLKRQELLAHG